MKILFCGFRHAHINSLYKKVAASDIFELAGCIESDLEARAAAENNLGAVFSDKSYEEWLASDIDAVAIGTAYGDRGGAIIKALGAGKHIISDKPVCTSLKELAKIRKLSEEKNLKIACMLDLRYLPQTIAAKKLIDGGSLGKIRNIAFNGQHCMGYATRPSWYFEKGMHGGTINDLAIHGIDLVRMLTGLEFVKTDGVRTWNAYAYKHKHFKDSAVFMARLENGAEVLADVSYSAPSQVFSMPTYWEFRIWCEKGLLTFNYIDSAVTVYEEGKTNPVRHEGIVSDEGYLSEFVSEIENGSQAVTDSVLKSTETALLIQKDADMEEQR